MHKKGPSREPGRPPSPEAQRRVKLTTKIDKTLLGGLRRLAKKNEKNINELIEEAVAKYWKLRR